MADPFDKYEGKLKAAELHVLTNFHRALALDSIGSRKDVPGIPHATNTVYDCDRILCYDMAVGYRPIDTHGAIRTFIGRKGHTRQILADGEMELWLRWKNFLQGTTDEIDKIIMLDKKFVMHIPREMKLHHDRQLERYKLLRVKNKLWLPPYKGVLYVNIIDATVKVFVKSLTADISDVEKIVLRKYEALIKFKQTKILPPRVIEQIDTGFPNETKTVCDYCGHYGRCWLEEHVFKGEICV